MVIIKYLIVNSRGSVSVREREPRMAGNEIAVRLQLSIPEAMFHRPVLKANLEIPTDAIPKSSITPEITTNIEDMIKAATGLEVAVTMVEIPKENDLE